MTLEVISSLHRGRVVCKMPWSMGDGSVAAAFKPTTQSLPSSAILQRLASSRAAALEAELETDKAAE